MSVIKSRRNESVIQFLETARELEIYTIKQCAKFPKRFMFLITKDIIDLAKSIFNNVKSANSVYPTNAAELQLRTNFIINANCGLQCLISQLDIAREFIKHTDNDKTIKSKIWQTWADLITSEVKMLSSLRKNDKERYKDL